MSKHPLSQKFKRLQSILDSIRQKEHSIWLEKDQNGKYKYQNCADTVLFDIEILKAEADDIAHALKPRNPEISRYIHAILDINPVITEPPYGLITRNNTNDTKKYTKSSSAEAF